MDYIGKGATISSCGKYRYLLWREWRGTHDPANWWWWDAVDGAGARLGDPKTCLFIMLNPSVADGERDDATIRRCVGFAKAWKYERLVVVNLFAHRATDPRELLALGHNDDPVGVRNQEVIALAASDAGIVVCAWGPHGRHLGQDETVLGWLGDQKTYALKLSKDGSPCHPLYLAASCTPIPFAQR